MCVHVLCSGCVILKKKEYEKKECIHGSFLFVQFSVIVDSIFVKDSLGTIKFS